MRLRILTGTFLLLFGLALYVGAVMALVARLPESAVLDFTLYGVAGVAWVAPAALLTRWMLRGP
ncbi:MAG TPA: DUF2842 domain-containing protein [Stellaceae bacterium]|nr:DUF2842 domain-containing protein [Stellaceae bacterium]